MNWSRSFVYRTTDQAAAASPEIYRRAQAGIRERRKPGELTVLGEVERMIQTPKILTGLWRAVASVFFYGGRCFDVDVQDGHDAADLRQAMVVALCGLHRFFEWLKYPHHHTRPSSFIRHDIERSNTFRYDMLFDVPHYEAALFSDKNWIKLTGVVQHRCHRCPCMQLLLAPCYTNTIETRHLELWWIMSTFEGSTHMTCLWMAGHAT